MRPVTITDTPWIRTLVELVTTIALPVAGLIVTPPRPRSNSLGFPVIVMFSAYVPRATTILSPEKAGLTAAWMVGASFGTRMTSASAGAAIATMAAAASVM